MWCRDWDSSSYLALWPPSKRLKSALTERRKGIKYTLPGMKYEFNEKRDQGIDVSIIMEKDFEVIDEDKNWNGLRQLLETREHLAAVEATGKILTLLGQGMDKSGRSSTLSAYPLEIWSIRFQLLFGLKKYTELLDEMTSFEELDAPDLFFQYHNEEKEGSMIPFALRMVHAEALVHSPLPIQAIGQVDRLIADVTMVMDGFTSDSPEAHVDGWNRRLKAVKYMRARIFHELKHLDLVVSSIEKMKDEESGKEQQALSFLLARIHLMRSQEERSVEIMKDMDDPDEGMSLHQETFLAMHYGDRKRMLESMEESNKRESTSMSVNNLAIACLFNGKSQEAATLLVEEARRCIRASEPLHPVIAQNIKTISEFTFATTSKNTILKELQSVIPQQ